MLRQSIRSVRTDATEPPISNGVAFDFSILWPIVGQTCAARYIWSYGGSFGEFGSVVVDAYVKDLPIARIDDNVLLCYEMNGSALPAEHGFPARLIVPGFYGTNSVKWLTRLTIRRDARTWRIHDSLVQRPHTGQRRAKKRGKRLQCGR